MIIFRTADDMLGAIHVAQAFDKNDLCVVSMVPTSEWVEDTEALRGKDSPPVMVKISRWLIVGQGAAADIEHIDRDIEELENGPQRQSYVEAVPEVIDGTRPEAAI